jgi:uncharacterized membrane protein
MTRHRTTALVVTALIGLLLMAVGFWIWNGFLIFPGILVAGAAAEIAFVEWAKSAGARPDE